LPKLIHLGLAGSKLDHLAGASFIAHPVDLLKNMR
jgi:hypothetical protein